MAFTHKLEESPIVLEESGDRSLMVEFSLDSHLLVDFCAKAWHERLKNHAEEAQRIERHVHHLCAPNGVSLGEHPWLVFLDVQVAFRAHLHGCSDTVL